MRTLFDAVANIADDISGRSRVLGRTLTIDPAAILTRDLKLRLQRPGYSPNGTCQLVEASNGWIAINLARDDDAASVAAWLGCDEDIDPWRAIATLVPQRSVGTLLDSAMLLSLPVAAVGESHSECAVRHHYLCPTRRCDNGPATVLDISTLWAGPLCAGLLAKAGADVIRLENSARPDPTPHSSPVLDRWINGSKRGVKADFSQPADRAMLFDIAANTDVLVTSARPRGLASLGLTPELLFAANPRLIWVAITAHGWEGGAGTRIGFGDDCAAAGGLLDLSGSHPGFAGDALADPLTGLLAAGVVFDILASGQGGLIDIALARSAGQVAAML